jgi:hypothetical protein
MQRLTGGEMSIHEFVGDYNDVDLPELKKQIRKAFALAGHNPGIWHERPNVLAEGLTCDCCNANVQIYHIEGKRLGVHLDIVERVRYNAD